MKKAVLCGILSGLLGMSLPAHAGGYRQTLYKYPSDGVVRYEEAPVHVYCSDCGEVAPLEAAPAILLSLKVTEEVPAAGANMASLPISSEKGAQTPPFAVQEQPVSAKPLEGAVADVPIEQPTQVVVYFGFNKSDLTEEHQQTLLGLRKGPYDVTGFTDDVGSEKNNNRVALKRAEVVSAFLKANGFTVRSVNGKGKCCYAGATGSDIPVRGKSRRVEVKLAEERQSALIGITPLMRMTTIVNGLSVGVLDKKAAAEADFRKDFPRITYQKFSKSVIPDLWEIVAGNNIFYYAIGGRLVIGDIVDPAGQNLTARRRDEEVAVKLQNLPLEKAMRVGNGSKVVIEVVDPDCPYCRRVEPIFESREDVTRYVFLIALPMHKEAAAKIKSILCAADQAEQYKEITTGKYDGNDVPINAECGDKGVSLAAEHEKVARELGASGTPLFFITGKRVEGANTALIEQLLNQK